MTVRKNFNVRYVDAQIELVSEKLDRETTIYVAGGTVMAIRGLKEGTKDIDIVVDSVDDLTRVRKALVGSGYHKPNQSLEMAYQRMKARSILDNLDGFRWELFEKIVAGKFHLSPGMKDRARDHRTSSKMLTVKLLAIEDVFLMKSVTEREGDLEDMAKIAQGRIDWNIIVRECEWQSKQTGRIWENSVCESLKELKAKYGVSSPVEKKICESAEKKILALEKQRS
jgi:uncharacterized nucleotidyltransferase DUF6036